MFERWLEEARLVAYRAVLQMCRKRPDRHDLAEEASSKAVMEAVQKGEGYFEGRGHLIGSLVIRAKGRFIEGLRGGPEAFDPERDPEGDDDPPEMDAIGNEYEEFLNEHKQAIWDALARMGSPCRDILVLSYIHGWSDMQIAKKIYGDDATDMERQRTRKKRLKCTSDMRRKLMDDGIDPAEWW